MVQTIFSILIPTYNKAPLLKIAIESILGQSFENYEIVVGDDCSSDNTDEIVKSIQNDKIKYYKNDKNLGYGRNLQACYDRSSGQIIFLMGHDDILLKDALLRTYKAFFLRDDIGVITRPYYWFYDDVKIPVRAIRPYNDKEDSVISIFDGKEQIESLFESLGQLSGLAYKKEYMDIDFHEEIFPAHIYPVASILKKYRAVYLKDYTVAIRIESSMTRHKPEIYSISPTKSWVKMFETVYFEKQFDEIRRQCVDFISRNYEGLVQLKNYASIKILFREIIILIKYRWINIFNFRFWLFTLATILIPRKILILIADKYKRKVLSKSLIGIVIEK
jgi:glycosyltransferase involved in cell wall biosynthesis